MFAFSRHEVLPGADDVATSWELGMVLRPVHLSGEEQDAESPVRQLSRQDLGPAAEPSSRGRLPGDFCSASMQQDSTTFKLGTVHLL